MRNSQSWLKIIGKVEKGFSPDDSTSPKTNVSWDLENLKKNKKKQYICWPKSKVASSDKSGRSFISCLYSYSYMKMYIPIAKQSKYQFLTEGKVNKQLSKYRAPPARYFRLHYLTIAYSLICRTYLIRRLLVMLTQHYPFGSQSKFQKMASSYIHHSLRMTSRRKFTITSYCGKVVYKSWYLMMSLDMRR